MDVRTKATDYELTSEVASYIEEKLAPIEKLLGQDAETTRCEVEVGRDAGNQRHGDNMYFAEINIVSPGSEIIRATNRAQSVNAAIDDAQAEVMRQMRREKQVHVRFLRKSGAIAKRLMRFGQD